MMGIMARKPKRPRDKEGASKRWKKEISLKSIDEKIRQEELALEAGKARIAAFKLCRATFLEFCKLSSPDGHQSRSAPLSSRAGKEIKLPARGLPSNGSLKLSP
jgi:hypothetical protein